MICILAHGPDWLCARFWVYAKAGGRHEKQNYGNAADSVYLDSSCW